MNESQKTFHGITIEELEGGAQVCLSGAATADLDAFPPGSGNYARRLHHARRRRFLSTVNMLKGQSLREGEGIVIVGDLQWLIERCAENSEGADLKTRIDEAIRILSEGD